MRYGVALLLVAGFFAATAATQEQPEPNRSPPLGKGLPPGRTSPFGPPTTASTPARSEPNARLGLSATALPPPRAFPAKAGKTITVEVLIAELIGANDAVSTADLLELEKTGKLSFSTRLWLTSLEEQPAFIQFGALTSRTSGRASTVATTVPLYTDINLGTIAQMTGRVEDDGSIVAQLYIERSALAGEEGPFNPQITTPPVGVNRLLANTTVRLKPGEPQFIGGRQAALSSETTKTWIVVTGHVGPLANKP